jgi:hypothetical protein
MINVNKLRQLAEEKTNDSITKTASTDKNQLQEDTRLNDFEYSLQSKLEKAAQLGESEAVVFRLISSDGIKLYSVGNPDPQELNATKLTGVAKTVWNKLAKDGLNPKFIVSSEITKCADNGPMHDYRFYISIAATWY